MERSNGESAANAVILYGSHYGSTRRYAQQLSSATGIPAYNYKDAPDFSNQETVIYLGGLYAGGVVGLGKTLRGHSPGAGQRLILVTVGLANPAEPKNRETILASIQKRLPAEWRQRARIFSLRGAMDSHRLSLRHRTMMKLLYQSLRHAPPDKQSAEGRAFLEPYGKQVDFIDFSALEPVIAEIHRR